MYEFESKSSFHIKGRGQSYVVLNPVQCNDFSHLIGHTVRIDGTEYEVRAVEHFAHAPPYHEGEEIGLLVMSL